MVDRIFTKEDQRQKIQEIISKTEDLKKKIKDRSQKHLVHTQIDVVRDRWI